MLISFKYKFIFIRTVKTASTSLEIFLGNLMDQNDIVTNIKPSYPGHRPRNTKYNNRSFYNHMRATEIRDIIGKTKYNSFFKFCVEREPVDKCISHFSMYKNSKDHHNEISNMKWSEYLDSKKFPIDYKKYTDDKGELIIDKILRYENLNSELRKTLNKLGINFLKLTPTAKNNYREKITPNTYEKKIIYENFKTSNMYTGYKLS